MFSLFSRNSETFASGFLEKLWSNISWELVMISELLTNDSIYTIQHVCIRLIIVYILLLLLRDKLVKNTPYGSENFKIYKKVLNKYILGTRHYALVMKMTCDIKYHSFFCVSNLFTDILFDDFCMFLLTIYFR